MSEYKTGVKQSVRGKDVSSFRIKSRFTTVCYRYTLILVVIATILTPLYTLLANYNSANAADTPTISSVSPDSGPVEGGTNVTITGSNFMKQAKASKVATGFGFSCAIVYDAPYCWGNNGNGQLGMGSTSPSSSSTPYATSTSGVLNGKKVTDIAAGNYHACAVADGKAYCWGYGGYGNLGNNSTSDASSPVAVYTGGVLSGKTVTKIAAGGYTTCAIANNQVYCWGRNYGGTLGNNSTIDSSIPVAVTTNLSGKTVTDITVGGAHACAVADGKAYCWGQNSASQLGTNNNTEYHYPVAVYTGGVLSGKTVTQINSNGQFVSNSNFDHTCAVADSKAYCWGYGGYGQLGNNSTSSSNIPVAVYSSGVLSGKTVTQVTVNDTGGCAIANNAAYCWGYGGHGELGQGSTSSSNVPVAVTVSGVLAGKSVTQISGGVYTTSTTTYSFVCAVASETLACWGDNNWGGLGNGNTSYQTSPVAVNESAWSDVTPKATSVTFDGVAAQYVTFISSTKIIAITPPHSDGAVDVSVSNPGTSSSTLAGAYYYGIRPPTVTSVSPDNGLPSGGTSVTVTGTGFADGITLSKVSTGHNHTCAIGSDGAGYCWGDNAYGELGLGTTGGSHTKPEKITMTGALSGLTLTSIKAGNGYTCAIASDARVYCWGKNGAGQLGDNSTTTRTAPKLVYWTGSLSGLTAIDLTVSWTDAGANVDGHTCIIASNNRGYCWGHNNWGQLGDNTTTNRSVPTALYTSSGATNLTHISAGFNLTCALKSTGAGYCWGLSASGELGNGTNTQYKYPYAVNMGTVDGGAFATIEAGGSHACGISSANRKVYCWGYNFSGQVGNLTWTNQWLPVAVNTDGALNGKDISSIDLGSEVSCAVTTDGYQACWGIGADYALGINNTNNQSIPFNAFAGSANLIQGTITSISAGWHTVCVNTTDQRTICWGDNGSGQVGDGTTTDKATPAETNTSALASLPTLTFDTSSATNISFVNSTTLTATTPAHAVGSVSVSAINPNGQTATKPNAYAYRLPAPTITSVSPTSGSISGGTTVTITGTNFVASKVKKVSTGLDTTACALATNHDVYCWGDNSVGQLGVTTPAYTNKPLKITMDGALAGTIVTDISSGLHFSCVVASGKPYCWGENTVGQLGNNSTATSFVPVAVTTSGALSGKTVTKVAAGFYHACAIADGKAYCWGDNSHGGLGNNSTTNSSVPVAVDTSGVLSGKTVTDISIGQYDTCAVADGKAYCWGYGQYSRLGIGSDNSDKLVPVAVDASGALSGKTVTKVSLGESHSCVLADSQAYCWGNNWAGQVGNNTLSQQNRAVAVTTTGVLSGKTITDLASGPYQSCVIASGGQYCWGHGDYGQLGDGNDSDSKVPVATDTSGVLSGKTVTGLGGGSVVYSCVVADDAIYCYGGNWDGNLGDGSYTDRHNPVATVMSSFTNGAPDVYFDSLLASNVAYVSSTTLTATTPAHTLGLVDVSVANPDSQVATLANAYTYTADPPSAPTNLTTTPGNNAVILNWQAPTNNGGAAISDYKIEYSANGGSSWSVFSHSASAATSATVTGLSIGTMYSFRVSAINSAGTGAPSNTATGTPIYITLDSSGAIAITAIPQGATTVSSSSHTLTVNTNDPTGYTITLEMSGATRNLVNSGNSISPSSGSIAAPSSLTVNTWGFRVDGSGGFGNGPTVQESNVSSSGYTWAGVPASGSPVTIKSSSSPATNQTTTVWYAMNASSNKPSGSYTGTLLYTAVSN